MTTQNGKQQQYTEAGQRMQGQQDKQKAIVAQVNDHRAFLEARLEKISKWVTQGVRPEAIVRFALMDIQTNKQLREATKESIYLALLACAVTGLEPGALKGEAYLVPFRDGKAGGIQKAQFIAGWKGLVKQARRSKYVEAITANVVREGDLFDLDLGTANTLVHKPALKNRGEVIGAYSIAKMSGGHHEIEWMDGDDLDAIKAMATKKGSVISPAWKDWEDQMFRKSPIRRLCKRLPMGADYFVTVALEDADDQIDVLDMNTPEGEALPSRARTQISAADVIDVEVESEETPEPADTADGARNDATAKPSEKPTEKAEPKTKAEPAPDIKPSPAAAKASAQPAPAAKSQGYTRGGRGPAAAPANELKPPSSAQDHQQPALQFSGKVEERPCATCSAPIEVPVEAPAGQKCEDCAGA